MTESRFIIRLNPVDVITLSGVLTTTLATGAALHHHYDLAVSLLFLAMLADGLDGYLARKYQLERPFGRYLDGFMDVLIYLVTPALVCYLSGFDGLYSLFLVALIGAGCTRLAVFNDIGNIQEDTGLAYLGMPVFWSVPLLAVFVLLMKVSPATAKPLLALSVSLFAYAMLLRRPFFKFKKLWQILSICIGGFVLFLGLHFAG